VDEALDNLCGWQRRRGQRLPETEARFAQLDAAETHRADKELHSNEFVETNSTSDDVPTAGREVRSTLLLGEERLNFLRLYERDVPARFVVTVEVPVAFESRACNDTYCAVFGVRATRSCASEDAFNRHDGLSFDVVLIVSCRLTYRRSAAGARPNAVRDGDRLLQRLIMQSPDRGTPLHRSRVEVRRFEFFNEEI
jgi:hypothetical protein